MIISTGIEKALGKMSHPFMTKAPKKLDVEESCLNIIEATYDKPTATSF